MLHCQNVAANQGLFSEKRQGFAKVPVEAVRKWLSIAWNDGGAGRDRTDA